MEKSHDKVKVDLRKGIYESPLGPLYLLAEGELLMKLEFSELAGANDNISGTISNAITQLDDYFRGSKARFDLPLALPGTELQQRVWKKLSEIEHGKTISYTELASSLNLSHAVRAVANAVGRNHLPVILPCHRVIGSNGSLTGYIGGISRKRWLLEFEKGQKRIFG